MLIRAPHGINQPLAMRTLRLSKLRRVGNRDLSR
jgi:hypothetical protein